MTENREIQCTVDTAQLQRITEEIGNIAYKAPTILKNASNATGKFAMKRIKEGIDKRYDITSSEEIDLENTIRRKSANYAHPETVINSQSPMTNMTAFYVSPRIAALKGKRPRVYMGHAVRITGNKKLIHKGSKAFIVRFGNRHHDNLVYRVPGEVYTNKQKLAERRKKKLDITKIMTFKTAAVPFMVSKMFRDNEKDIAKNLDENVRKEIDRFLKRRQKYDT